MKNNVNVLLVEDDPNLGQLLSDYLNAKGYKTQLCVNGEDGLREFAQNNYGFLILDVMMPLKDGFSLAKEIRTIDKQVPILFLTAKSMKEDKLEGFKMGGDDYMTKPFSMEELLARMEAILRRAGSKSEDKETEVYQLGGFSFDYKNRTLILDGESKKEKLTTKESELLHLLCKSEDNTIDRNIALRAIWGDDSYFNGRSMDVYITKLRKYLKRVPNVEIINIHGKGFKLIVN